MSHHWPFKFGTYKGELCTFQHSLWWEENCTILLGPCRVHFLFMEHYGHVSNVGMTFHTYTVHEKFVCFVSNFIYLW